jgi:4-phytase/acid phosphatase
MLRDPLKPIVRRVMARTLCVIAAGAFPSEAGAAEYTLERVVLVSRHGVRAPNNVKDPSLADVASRPWPTWIVNAPADLTPRGEELASRMGEYYRLHFAARGVLRLNGCPAENQIHVRADVDQRTRRTGDALLAGAFPACGLRALYRMPKDQPDPLFHPLRGACRIEKRDQPGLVKRIEQGGNLLDSECFTAK